MRRSLFSLLGTLAIAGFAIAWLAAARADTEIGVIILGGPVSETGKFAEEGRYVRDGYMFAVDHINRNGGIRVNGRSYRLALKLVDDQSKPSRDVMIGENLIRSEHVKFLLGPYSTELTRALEPIAEKYHVPLVDANGPGSSIFNRNYHYIFGVLSSTDTYFDQLMPSLQRVAGKLGKKPQDLTVALAMADEGYSHDLHKDVLRNIDKHHLRLIIDDELPSGGADIAMTLKRVNQMRPDILVIANQERATPFALNEMHQAGIHVPILFLGHCGKGNATVYTAIADELFCPVQWSSSLPYSDRLFGNAANFANEFHRAFGYVPPYEAAQSAAAIEVYADAFSRSRDLRPDTVRGALAATNLKTFYGPIRFDEAGRNVAKKMFLSETVGGTSHLVMPR